MLHGLSSLSGSTNQQLTEPTAMNTTELLLKREKTSLVRRPCWQETLEVPSSAAAMFLRRTMMRAQISRSELTLHTPATHTTELARLNIPDKVAQYLTGHAMGHDVHRRVDLHYTPELSTLKEVLEKVRF